MEAHGKPPEEACAAAGHFGLIHLQGDARLQDSVTVWDPSPYNIMPQWIVMMCLINTSMSKRALTRTTQTAGLLNKVGLHTNGNTSLQELRCKVRIGSSFLITWFRGPTCVAMGRSICKCAWYCTGHVASYIAQELWVTALQGHIRNYGAPVEA